MGRPTWKQRIVTLVGRVRPSGRAAPVSTTAPPYAGDFEGIPTITYAPVDDHDPDPGEVVWAWVPYEEDHSQGKDRPVIVIGRDGQYLLALAFTSKDHDRDVAQEARAGRFWFDLGSGAWDPTGRPSEVRLDRVLRLDPNAVRREGATLDRDRFLALADEVRRTGGGR